MSGLLGSLRERGSGDSDGLRHGKDASYSGACADHCREGKRCTKAKSVCGHAGLINLLETKSAGVDHRAFALVAGAVCS